MRIRKYLKLPAIFLLFLGFFFVLPNASVLFASEEIQIVVTKIDAPLRCREMSSFILGRRGRSSVPEAGFGGYCGYVKTDPWVYVLPQTYDQRYLSESRASILSKLREGCTYTVRISGFGDVFRGGNQIGPLRHIISKVISEDGCSG